MPPGAVVFDRVTFGYPAECPGDQGRVADLAPGHGDRAGRSVRIGKSTLAALLARFHDVDSGSIRLDGKDIRSLSADELYRTRRLRAAETQLVAGTVAENIALADPEADPARIEQAARDAQIHERVSRLPDGYRNGARRVVGVVRR